MPDRAIMGHTPPTAWRRPFTKLLRGQLDAIILAPEVYRSLAQEAKKGGFSDAPKFLVALRDGTSGGVALESLYEKLRTVERNALDPDFAASMWVAAMSIIRDFGTGTLDLSNLEYEFYRRALVARYNCQFPAPVEPKLCEKYFHNDIAAMECWKESLDGTVLPMITDLAEQVALDSSGESIHVPPLHRNRRIPEVEILNSEVDVVDLEDNDYLGEDENEQPTI